MNDPLMVLVVVAILIVLAILMFGLGTFGKGGEFNQRNANKIMRWRVIMQAVAIIVILIVVAIRSGRG